jgi:UDP-glucuronate 4-epimerase
MLIMMSSSNKTRLAQLQQLPNFSFHQTRFGKSRRHDSTICQPQRFDGVVNLAAQVGVRYSVKNPQAYVQIAISVGFGNILEGCRYSGVEHLVFASSSSVYGANTKIPFSVQ